MKPPRHSHQFPLCHLKNRVSVLLHRHNQVRCPRADHLVNQVRGPRASPLNSRVSLSCQANAPRRNHPLSPVVSHLANRLANQACNQVSPSSRASIRVWCPVSRLCQASIRPPSPAVSRPASRRACPPDSPRCSPVSAKNRRANPRSSQVSAKNRPCHLNPRVIPDGPRRSRLNNPRRYPPLIHRTDPHMCRV